MAQKSADPSPHLPLWDNDPLSSLLADASRNERITALKLPKVYSLLKQVHAVFESVADAIRTDPQEGLLLPYLLFFRVHSSFLVAVRLTMAGQAFEANLALRAAIEQAWYALHIARDPRPPERIMIWLQRHETPEAQKKCKDEFTVSRVRSTHEALDSTSAGLLRQLYDVTIDFGAHPNERGIFASVQREETERVITHRVGILYPEPRLMTSTLKIAVEVAITVLKVSQLISPSQLRVEGLDLCIGQIVREMAEAFDMKDVRGE